MGSHSALASDTIRQFISAMQVHEAVEWQYSLTPPLMTSSPKDNLHLAIVEVICPHRVSILADRLIRNLTPQLATPCTVPSPAAVKVVPPPYLVEEADRSSFLHRTCT